MPSRGTQNNSIPATRLEVMGIEDIRTAYRSPWQNAYAERVIGTIRRECLDHMIIFSEKHLRKVLAGCHAHACVGMLLLLLLLVSTWPRERGHGTPQG